MSGKNYEIKITLKDGIKLQGKVLACMVGNVNKDDVNVQIEEPVTTKFYFIAEEDATDSNGQPIIKKGEVIELTNGLVIDNAYIITKINKDNFGNFVEDNFFSFGNIKGGGGNLFSKNKTSKRTHSKHKKTRKTHVK